MKNVRQPDITHFNQKQYMAINLAADTAQSMLNVTTKYMSEQQLKCMQPSSTRPSTMQNAEVTAACHLQTASLHCILLAADTDHLAALSRCRSVRQLMPRYAQISLMF